MTISSPTFQRLQSGIKSADDLRVKEPINAMMAWLSGGLVTQLNTHFSAISQSNSVQIANHISVYASTRPTFSAHKNGTNQVSISSTVQTDVTFSTEEWDTGSHFASNVWTPPAGIYRVNAQVSYTSANAVDNEQLDCRLVRDTTVYKRAQINRPGTTAVAVGGSWLVSVNGTQTLKVAAFKGGAGDGTVSGATFDTYFQGEAIA